MLCICARFDFCSNAKAFTLSLFLYGCLECKLFSIRFVICFLYNVNETSKWIWNAVLRVRIWQLVSCMGKMLCLYNLCNSFIPIERFAFTNAMKMFLRYRCGALVMFECNIWFIAEQLNVFCYKTRGAHDRYDHSKWMWPRQFMSK